MQPLKPEERDRIKKDNPQATPQDLERYQNLLSKRFTVDPDRPSPQAAPVGDKDRAAVEKRSVSQSIEKELRELHARIFRKAARAR